jgi:predicted nucleic acid-binding protein
VLQRKFDALPLDDAVAASYGRLAAAVVDAGRQPRARTMDLLIAATAHAHSARLYTRNAADLVGADTLVDVVPV